MSQTDDADELFDLDKDWERGLRLSKAAAPFSKKAFCHW
jgi:hypothetical protein